MTKTTTEKRFVFPVTLKVNSIEYAPGKPVLLTAKQELAYLTPLKGKPYTPEEGAAAVAPTKPTGKKLEEAIAGVIPTLLLDQEALTARDEPSVFAIEKILGYDIDAADRDKAWAAFNKKNDPDKYDKKVESKA